MIRDGLNPKDPVQQSRERYIKVHGANKANKLSYLRSSHSLIEELAAAIKIWIKPGSRVLEIGCGGGHTANFLKELNFEVIATDFSPVALDAAKSAYPKVNFQLMNAQELDFKKDAFDAVVSVELIEHLPEPVKHVKEVNRVLRTGGVYIFKTPNRLIHDLFYLWNKKTRLWHPSVMSVAELTQLFVKNGFHIDFIKMDRLPLYQLRKAVLRFGPLGRPFGYVLKALPIGSLPKRLQSSLICVAIKKD